MMLRDQPGYGECILTRVEDFDDPTGFHLHVNRADPRILITRELLNQIVTSPPEQTRAHLVDDVLTINGDNRKVIYRIGSYVADRNAYEAEWPD